MKFRGRIARFGHKKATTFLEHCLVLDPDRELDRWMTIRGCVVRSGRLRNTECLLNVRKGPLWLWRIVEY